MWSEKYRQALRTPLLSTRRVSAVSRSMPSACTFSQVKAETTTREVVCLSARHLGTGFAEGFATANPSLVTECSSTVPGATMLFLSSRAT